MSDVAVRAEEIIQEIRELATAISAYRGPIQIAVRIQPDHLVDPWYRAHSLLALYNVLPFVLPLLALSVLPAVLWGKGLLCLGAVPLLPAAVMLVFSFVEWVNAKPVHTDGKIVHADGHFEKDLTIKELRRVGVSPSELLRRLKKEAHELEIEAHAALSYSPVAKVQDHRGALALIEEKQ
jgi:hypothetical protein